MKIKIGFFAVLLFISLAISRGYHTLIPLLAVIIHEGGHIIAAVALGKGFSGLELGIFGARLNLSERLLSYGEEFAICIAGPAANILSVLFILGAYMKSESESLLYFILSSLFLAFINLLPIKTFDGGRMLFCIIARISDEQKADFFLKVFSFISLFFIWSLSLYLLLRHTSSLSLFVFSASVFASIFVAEGRYR